MFSRREIVKCLIASPLGFLFGKQENTKETDKEYFRFQRHDRIFYDEPEYFLGIPEDVFQHVKNKSELSGCETEHIGKNKYFYKNVELLYGHWTRRDIASLKPWQPETIQEI